MGARGVGLGITGAGAVLQVVGLGIDAWLHARDQELAAREGVLTLGNAGHAVFVAGLALVVLGVLLAFLGPALYDGGGRAGPSLVFARIAAPTLVLVLIAGGAIAGSSSSLGQGHGEHEAQATDDHAADHHAPTLRATRHVAAHGGGDAHGTGGLSRAHALGANDPTHTEVAHEDAAHEDAAHEPEHAVADPGHGHADEPVEPENPVVLDEQIAAARTAALAHPTAADAMAAGYVKVSTYISKIAAHYVRLDRFDRYFDPAMPESLLYDGEGPEARVVGVAYLSDAALIGFAGPWDHWHSHPHLCTDPVTGLIIDAELDQLGCVALGGNFLDGLNLWMVHAWVVPGLESPDGIFSEGHPLLP